MEILEQQASTLHHLVETESNATGNIKQIIENLKLVLLDFPFMDPNSNIPPEKLCLIRQIYEDDAIVSIRNGDMEEFERAITFLKCAFLKATNLPPSNRLPILIAAHLIYISSEGKEAAFHLELEISRSIIGKNVFLDYAESLQRTVDDNSFSRLFELESKPPSPLFSKFTSSLLKGARNRHANSIEKSYEFLSLSDLTTILHFASIDEAKQFASSRGWKEEGGKIIFSNQEKTKDPVDMVARSVDLAVQISALA